MCSDHGLEFYNISVYWQIILILPTDFLTAFNSVILTFFLPNGSLNTLFLSSCIVRLVRIKNNQPQLVL